MTQKNKPQTKRLCSLDALRGFNMFWIMGVNRVFFGLATLTGLPFFQWWSTQQRHPEWHGFTFIDLIFPLFIFITGITFNYYLVMN